MCIRMYCYICYCRARKRRSIGDECTVVIWHIMVPHQICSPPLSIHRNVCISTIFSKLRTSRNSIRNYGRDSRFVIRRFMQLIRRTSIYVCHTNTTPSILFLFHRMDESFSWGSIRFIPVSQIRSVELNYTSRYSTSSVSVAF